MPVPPNRERPEGHAHKPEPPRPLGGTTDSPPHPPENPSIAARVVVAVLVGLALAVVLAAARWLGWRLVVAAGGLTLLGVGVFLWRESDPDRTAAGLREHRRRTPTRAEVQFYSSFWRPVAGLAVAIGIGLCAVATFAM